MLFGFNQTLSIYLLNGGVKFLNSWSEIVINEKHCFFRPLSSKTRFISWFRAWWMSEKPRFYKAKNSIWRPSQKNVQESSLNCISNSDWSKSGFGYSFSGKSFLLSLYFSTDFIWEVEESGDINVCWNKTLNCYPNYTNGLYSENNLSNKKPNKFLILV